ncbi:NAD-glutamate dehydrogenase [Gilvimarinus xylanilyticus]|uniref:NAD-glutamate dehydrogenase n=1 Tax=Gilvimarinus xylanilyticus TaxID=2944139 RepID=A0A9X2HUZ1_9GAMM|nr:NAD-glutamate dehydrogenase [Gilvimarinus xylanilyticus]MCP8898690.1 NAD-glutamate dehydrogenase [Gilvimarinus xylanilyticus]
MGHEENSAIDVEAISRAVCEAVPEDECRACTEFVRLFFHHYRPEEMAAQGAEAKIACVRFLWRLLNSAGAAPKVRVFNPDKDQHGWSSPYTLVAIWQEDMPFLVDSIRIELAARNIPIYSIKSTPFCATREAGKLQHLELAGSPETPAEALVYLEIGAISDQQLLNQLEESFCQVLAVVQQVVADFAPLKKKMLAAADNLEVVRDKAQVNEATQTQNFLRWLADNHFTFLAYTEFDLIEREGKSTLRENREARLGLFDDDSKAKYKVLDDAHPGVERFYLSPSPIAFSKSPQRSRVHRNAYPDYVVVKRYNDAGEVCGEARFLGLYTSSVYNISPRRIPLLDEKIAHIYQRMELNEWSHEGKALEQIVETFPRDELFQASASELYDTLQGILSISERYQVRLFARRDRFGKFVTCLLYVPRDLFSTRLREKIQQYIADKVGACDQEFNTFFSESVLARVHLVFRIAKGSGSEFDAESLEQNVAELARSWNDRLFASLRQSLDEERARHLLNRYGDSFGPGYQDAYSADEARRDVLLLDRLAPQQRQALDIYTDANLIRCKLFVRDQAIALSDIIPVLENFGFCVLSEHPYTILDGNGERVWLHDFYLQPQMPDAVDINEGAEDFTQALWAVRDGFANNDGFNKLVLGAGLRWRQVNMLRVYAAYMKQTQFYYAGDILADALVAQPALAKSLCEYFTIKFDPEYAGDRVEQCQSIESEIYRQLEDVPDLGQDRIVRHYLALMKATLRCNFYQKLEREFLCFKFSARDIPDIPEPKPEFEIFVFSPRFEGVHLRGSCVARGGLRWSDRFLDYRTEVLGLVKAQQVKNAVIVPSGAKGGFICKQAAGLDREQKQEEGIACYRQFITALLDLTDNLHDGEIQPPDKVVRHDSDDPYLVVAADKGTASFSDIANEVAQNAGFWLGDAFASGGSNGYDHKAMGITAKGAWISVQRHFKEQGVDVQKDPVTVLGIGDMAGDVFGNGMLLSRALKLTAAFNHMHIFIDPNPEPEASFNERKRLFEKPRSQWSDYDEKLISEGGGVFERSAKSIAITPPMRECFDIEAKSLTPNELLHALLQAPVDLIWNGGIGTYVKAESESHADVGDKANDSIRVNGGELRCRVIGEGGNLGMTQAGRIEFCRAGGACNSDFIDNSAGVDCSDHEVNIKIALAELVKAGKLTESERNQLLESMTDEVEQDVLQNNYRQTQAISLVQRDALARTSELRRFINQLEEAGRLNRKLENLPSDDVLLERQASGDGLTRPELAVLISYAKVGLKEDLAVAEIADDPVIAPLCEAFFPDKMQRDYPEVLQQHQLRREIVATALANEIVNYQGATFVQRLQDASGAGPVTVARAYVLARDSLNLSTLWERVEQLDFAVEAHTQLALMKQLMQRMRHACRWFLRNRRGEYDLQQEIERFAEPLREVRECLRALLGDDSRANWDEQLAKFTREGVEDDLARDVVSPGYLYSGLGIVDVADRLNQPFQPVAELYVALVARLQLDGFALQLSEARVDNYWQAMARESYMDDLESQLRSLTYTLAPHLQDSSAGEVLAEWESAHEHLLKRWSSMVAHTQANTSTDYAMFAVALRELLDLAQVTRHTAD